MILISENVSHVTKKMATGAEVHVHQRGGEVVGVDGEVAHALVSEFWTLRVGGSGCRCHSANTRTHINFFKIRLKVYITFHTAGCERLGLVEKNRDIMSHFIVSCLHRMFVEGLKFCYKFLTKIFIIQMNANVSNEFNVY